MSLKSRLKKKVRKAYNTGKGIIRSTLGLGARSAAAGDMAGLGAKAEPTKIGGARTAGAGTLYTKEEYE